MEEFRELFLTSMANITEQIAQMGSRLDDLSTQVALVQEQVEVLNTQVPALEGDDTMLPPPHHRERPKIRRGTIGG